MIETVSKKVTSFFIEKGIIEESKRNMCEYSLYTRMLTCITMLFMLGISIPAIGLFKSFILIIGILALRKRTGGFHANRAEKCFLLSNMVIFVLTWIIYPIFNEFRIIFLSIMYTISILLICFISPINHPNNPLGDDELKDNCINVKNTETGIQETIRISALYNYIVSDLNKNARGCGSCGGCGSEECDSGCECGSCGCGKDEE